MLPPELRPRKAGWEVADRDRTYVRPHKNRRARRHARRCYVRRQCDLKPRLRPAPWRGGAPRVTLESGERKLVEPLGRAAAGGILRQRVQPAIVPQIDPAVPALEHQGIAV